MVRPGSVCAPDNRNVWKRWTRNIPRAKPGGRGSIAPEKHITQRARVAAVQGGILQRVQSRQSGFAQHDGFFRNIRQPFGGTDLDAGNGLQAYSTRCQNYLLRIATKGTKRGQVTFRVKMCFVWIQFLTRKVTCPLFVPILFFYSNETGSTSIITLVGPIFLSSM